MSCAGLIYGPMVHHIDHVAVLCCLLNIPLIVTDEHVAHLMQLYYPECQVLHWDYLQVAALLVENFETIFCSLPRLMFDDAFFLMQTLQGKHVKTIWMPHGNSDKENLAPLCNETTALVYGKKMANTFLNKPQAPHPIFMGNFRQLYWRQKVSYPLPFNNVILYAPTWNDFENSTSFFEATSHLIHNLPKEMTLVIKPHPNLPPFDCEEKPNLYLLKDFPPIYPLLERTSIYIGDASSIGYDFLAFNRPMFFLNQNRKPTHLMRCGITIDPTDYGKIYEILAHHLPNDRAFSKIREEMYADTFGKEQPWETIQKEIFSKL
jgi:hypothetical protein